MQETTQTGNAAAVKRYQSKCDAIMIRPPKDDGAKIRAAAAEVNQSVQAYILEAVRDRMGKEGK